MTQRDQDPNRPTAEASTLEVVEEHARIRKEKVISGGVRLETWTDTTTQMIPVALHGTEVEVHRVPVGEVVETAPTIREEDGVTIIPVLKERPVVRTELVLVEEVHIRRRESVENVEMPVELRKQHIIETQLEPEDLPKAND